MKKNIIVLLLDCLRGDMILRGKRRDVTRTLDNIAGRGTVFTNAVSSTSTTTPSVASLLTGNYSFSNGVIAHNGYKLSDDTVTLAKVFKDNGYETYAKVTGPLSEETGFQTGFDNYEYRDREYTLYNGWKEELIDFLDHLKSKETPWLFLAHFWELHVPRQVPEEYDSSRYGRNDYERALSALDKQLGEILEHVDLDRTIIVVHGDHGEGLRKNYWDRFLRKKDLFLGKGEPPMFWFVGHAHHIYDFLIRVPIIFYGINQFPIGTQIEKQARQIDILPTLADAAGIELNDEIHGKSLIKIVNNEIDEEPAIIEACGEGEFNEEKWILGIRTNKWKYFFAPRNDQVTPALYNLQNDPDERTNIIEKAPEIAESLRSQLFEIRGSFDVIKTGEEMSEDERQQRMARLMDLGYM